MCARCEETREIIRQGNVVGKCMQPHSADEDDDSLIMMLMMVMFVVMIR